MYNEEIKSRFIDEFTTSESRKRAARLFFNTTEPSEQKLLADICTLDAESVYKILDDAVGGQKRSASTRVSILNAYLKWCVDNGVPNAHMVEFETDDLGLSKFRRQYISGPSQLQKFLDVAFTRESEGTQDNMLRCVYWLAFSGMSENDIGSVLASDVNLELMVVNHVSKETGFTNRYPIYLEAVPAVRNCVELTAFNRNQYNSDGSRSNGKLVMQRSKGNELLRITTGVPSLNTIRVYLNNANIRVNSKAMSGAIPPSLDLSLSYHRVWLSGLFYRMYESERSQVSTEDILQLAVELYMQCFPGDPDVSTRALRMRYNSILRDIKVNYARWKQVFT